MDDININDNISENVFKDEELERQQDIEIKVDENGNPVIPEGWTFLTHGSSLDRWDTSLLGNDFTVGNGNVNGREVKGRPLCCVERSIAKYDYERNGSNTAKNYGGEQQAFEIRVLFYKNPRSWDGKIVKDKLNQDELKDVTEYYMYQEGRHPAVPVGTKLVFVKSGNFDEITNTSENNILWYIPEQYLKQYLDDVQQTQEIKKTILEEITDTTLIQDESKPTFDQSLLSAGFEIDTIDGLKRSIQTVLPEILKRMDRLLPRTKTKEQKLSKGGTEDGNEQDYR